MENQALPSTPHMPDSKFHPVHAKMDVIRKGHTKDSQRNKVEYEPHNTDTQNFSSESKKETEYVSVVGTSLGVGGGEVPGIQPSKE